MDTLQIIRNIARPLGNESIKKILKSISPLLISGGLDVRGSVCDVLDALAGNDSSLLKLVHFCLDIWCYFEDLFFDPPEDVNSLVYLTP